MTEVDVGVSPNSSVLQDTPGRGCFFRPAYGMLSRAGIITLILNGHVGMRALICGHGLSPWQCVLLSRRDPSPNRMIGITGPDYSLEQVSGDSVRDVVDWGSIFATNSFSSSDDVPKATTCAKQ